MQEVLFSDPVVMHTKVFFHLNSFAFDWNTIDDLKGLKIGAIAQFTYGAEFDQATRHSRTLVDYVTSDIQNLKKLLAGRIQIFPSNINAGYELVNTFFTPEEASLFVHHPKPIQEENTCVIFTKNNPEKSRRLLETFNRGLGKLKQLGIYDKFIGTSRRKENRQKQ